MKVVAVAPAVVTREGQVRTAGSPCSHATLGPLEDWLDAKAGPGVIDAIAGRAVLDGRFVKGERERLLAAAFMIRVLVLMTLMPEAQLSDVITALAGDLALVPWSRQWRAASERSCLDWRKALGPAPLEELRAAVLAAAAGEHAARPGQSLVTGRSRPLSVHSADGSLLRVPDTPANRAAFGSVGTADDSAAWPAVRLFPLSDVLTLVTDLLDWEEYPAPELAGLCKRRWDGSETGLREAKAPLHGAGPGTGAMLRSGSPDLIAQEIAAWTAATEMTRGVTRAAALTAQPAAKGRRAGQPVRYRDLSLARARRLILAAIRSGKGGYKTLTGQIARFRAVVDRNRHRARKSKSPSTFGHAGPKDTITRTAPAVITMANKPAGPPRADAAPPKQPQTAQDRPSGQRKPVRRRRRGSCSWRPLVGLTHTWDSFFPSAARLTGSWARHYHRNWPVVSLPGGRRSRIGSCRDWRLLTAVGSRQRQRHPESRNRGAVPGSAPRPAPLAGWPANEGHQAN